jgi:hypothetical protein
MTDRKAKATARAKEEADPCGMTDRTAKATATAKAKAKAKAKATAKATATADTVVLRFARG